MPGICRSRLSPQLSLEEPAEELELEERTWFIGDVAAVHAEEDYDVSRFPLCDRRSYLLIGEEISER